jgi:hypothetical protein
MYGSMGIEIPRVAREQAKVGKKISPDKLQYGDLIFFATDKHRPHKITHVGMYLGDGWFTHASTIQHEVIYSNLFTSPYYKKRLRVCRRYLPSSTTIPPKEQPWERNNELPSVSTPPSHTSATQTGKAIIIQAPMRQIEQEHGTEGSFYVQVGSFTGRPKSSLLYRITRQGLQYKIIKYPRGGQTINKLLIGPYRSRKDALEIRDKVRTHIQKDAFIAEIR